MKEYKITVTFKGMSPYVTTNQFGSLFEAMTTTALNTVKAVEVMGSQPISILIEAI